MATTDPNAAAQRWAQNLGASTQKITDGINGVQQAPGQAAAQQSQAYVQGVTRSVDKWRTNVAAVGLQEWKDAAINKGVARIASGAQAAQPKFAQFMTQFLPHVNQVKSTLPARGDLEQNIARMTAQVRGTAKFRYRRGA
jgi:maltooligosyltrehalose synthase